MSTKTHFSILRAFTYSEREVPQQRYAAQQLPEQDPDDIYGGGQYDDSREGQRHAAVIEAVNPQDQRMTKIDAEAVRSQFFQNGSQASSRIERRVFCEQKQASRKKYFEKGALALKILNICTGRERPADGPVQDRGKCQRSSEQQHTAGELLLRFAEIPTEDIAAKVPAKEIKAVEHVKRQI